MECKENVIHYLSWGFIVSGVAYLFRQTRFQTPYGRYVTSDGTPGRTCPAKLAWFLQELPSFLVPMLLLLSTDTQPSLGKDLLLWTFCLHYFQRLLYNLRLFYNPSRMRMWGCSGVQPTLWAKWRSQSTKMELLTQPESLTLPTSSCLFILFRGKMKRDGTYCLAALIAQITVKPLSALVIRATCLAPFVATAGNGFWTFCIPVSSMVQIFVGPGLPDAV
ncbi:uncharacterized protein LOC115178280 isoform X2 [Salmo trutta]|uniref:uncharacterized protein LOC115178280 isoform X2 n=1 Tax=Salmo trutta TaxID=8032 RepID=UPI0011322F9C|nr:uncharacterized protein LOC115178280 isoform X2 [Salmo trutta]